MDGQIVIPQQVRQPDRPHRLHIRITLSLNAALQSLCEASGLSKQELVELLLDQACSVAVVRRRRFP